MASEHKFVSEPLKPDLDSLDPATMIPGGPGIPRRFGWRSGTLEIASIVRTWRETGACRHGSAEQYVRKHWYEVETVSNGRAKLYFERQSRGGNPKRRWWLYSIEDTA